jgi:hypothetical protein
MWSHKSCDGLDFGRLPNGFVCRGCDPSKSRRHDIRPVSFDTFVPDRRVAVYRKEFLSSLPDGLFRTMIEEELQYTELSFRATLEKYFRKFASLLFDRGHEFWRIFVGVTCTVVDADKTRVTVLGRPTRKASGIMPVLWKYRMDRDPRVLLVWSAVLISSCV